MNAEVEAQIAARDAAIREAQEKEGQIAANEAKCMAGFTPLSDRVVIQRSKRGATKSGILLPERSKERPVTGVITHIGCDVKKVKVGQIALFMAYAGIDVELPDGTLLESHWVCTVDEIFGVWDVAPPSLEG